MKLKIAHLETPLQEICFLVAIVTAAFIISSGLLFLFIPSEDLQSSFGVLGTKIFFQIFHTFGLSTFLISISVLYIAEIMIARCHCLSDVTQNTVFFAKQIFFHACFLVLITSFLTVFQYHFQYTISPRLDQGAGGMIGQMIGGSLYNNFGIYGALTSLTCMILIVGISSGYIALVHLLLWTREQIYNFFFYLFLALKKGLQYTLFYTNEFNRSIGLDLQIKLPFLPPLQNTKRANDLNDNDQDIQEEEQGTQYQDTEYQNTESQDMPSQEIEETIQEQSDEASGESLALNKKQQSKNARRSKKVKKSPQSNTSETEAVDEPKDSAQAETQAFTISIKKWTKTYRTPDVNLLSPVSKKPKSQENQSQKLEECFKSFQISGQVLKFHVGATLTMYEFQPDPGVKVSKIAKLSDDLALLLGAKSIRILTPIPGKMTVGIEIPNKNPYGVSFREMVKAVQKTNAALPLALGLDVYDHVIVEDLCSMPHLLVSGSTGSGKSVFINAAINSLLFTRSPKHLRFLMIDPKMIELNPYNGIPHLIYPVVTDLTEAKNALCWAEKEMDLRYQKFSDLHSRNIDSFNETIKKESQKAIQRRMGKTFSWEWAEMPYIVIIIDELADLMITQGKLVEIPITRIAQKARACGIHLIMATQRPSADIVTGLIKTNFPTRIAFKVASSIDSRTILDTTGAEKLLGKGDMLFMRQGGHIDRVQGCFFSEKDVKKVNDFLK